MALYTKNILLLLALLAMWTGCARPQRMPAPVRPTSVSTGAPLPRFAFTIQAGAFAQVENAARLAERLRLQGLDATYFPAPGNLYRVRFGDFPDRPTAKNRAESLRSQNVIGEYWIVTPGEQPAMRLRGEVPALRRSLVETAQKFLGAPYLWGGCTEEGFDCSGLAMAVYQLNGLRLPRSSREQFAEGRAVMRDELHEGDLVFFATAGGQRVSHVGVYTGAGTFIHAPSKGKTVRAESLTTDYYRERFLGGRSYL